MSNDALKLYEELYKSVKNIKSYQAFTDILSKEKLKDYHTADLVKALFNQRYILSYEKGMNRHLTAYAYMRALKNYNKNFKFIMVVKNGDIELIKNNIQEYCKLKVSYTTAESKIIDKNLINSDFITSDVLLITHECLSNVVVLNLLYEVKHLYNGLIIDSANELSNIQGNQGAFGLLTMAKNFLYVLAICDNTIIKNIPMLTNLIYIVNRNVVGSFKATIDTISLNGFELFDNILSVRKKHVPGVMSSYL